MEEWCARAQIPMESVQSGTSEVVREAAIDLMVVLALEYSPGTMETCASADRGKLFAMKGWGPLRDWDRVVKDVLEGHERWYGKPDAAGGKLPVEAEHVAALMNADLPDDWTMAGDKGWRFMVTFVLMSWEGGLRPSEARQLSA